MDIFMIIGAIILYVFYGSYYFKMFMQARSGIKTDRMARGSKPRKTFIVEIILKTATFTMAVVQVNSIIFANKLVLLIQNNNIRYLGVLFGILGTSMFIIAMTTMKDSWRAGIDNTQKTKIIQSGIYQNKWDRNLF